MRYLFLLLLSFGVYAEDIQIKRVVDGDTFIVSAPFLPEPLKKEMRFRLSDVDTPGINRWANCDKENRMGYVVRGYVEKLIKESKEHRVKIVGVDKYGRWLGQIYLDGKSLSDNLVQKNLARHYYGGKKLGWCN
jgi:micrococcal nuclease